MVIGNGQLANIFKDLSLDQNIVVFASGVSNSNCTDTNEFEREKQLLFNTLKSYSKEKFIYFSSCALSADNYPKNKYYSHKKNMEKIIKENHNNYYIFRLPQLFGELKIHKTLINFLYERINGEQIFQVYDQAYRYVIEINDVTTIVEAYIKYSNSNITIDIANPHRYKVLDIVHIFEQLLNKKAMYNLIKKDDKYLLDLKPLIIFINNYDLDITFNENYLSEKLKQKLEGISK